MYDEVVMEKTFFYVLGSIFFGAAAIAVVILVFYCLKILKTLSKTSSEIKEKVENFSSCVKIFTNIFEKLITTFKKYDRRKSDKEKLG